MLVYETATSAVTDDTLLEHWQSFASTWRLAVGGPPLSAVRLTHHGIALPPFFRQDSPPDLLEATICPLSKVPKPNAPQTFKTLSQTFRTLLLLVVKE